jgi:hypothetical protein
MVLGCVHLFFLCSSFPSFLLIFFLSRQFLAGTCALLSQDRELCREGVRQCGPLAGYRDNALALERIWREQDETGWLVPWRQFLQERNPPMFVGFL